MDAPFGSSTERSQVPYRTSAEVGPGAYRLPASIKKALPAFVPFSSTSSRSSIIPVGKESPAPGNYESQLRLETSYAFANAFNSRTKRFQEISGQNSTDLPGPGSYDAKLTFDIHPAKRQIPQKPRYETGPLQLLAPHIKPVVPSIPTRYQSYGYEDAQDGRLIPQEPVRPGFTGLGNDSAGPGDYEPDISLKYAAVPAANFAKSTERVPIDKWTNNSTNVPGPGYYTTPTSFGNYDDSSQYSFRDYAAKQRQMAIFESKTFREFPLSSNELKHRTVPGPADYHLPELFKPESIPKSKQCFASTVPRFADTTAKSNRIQTCPGLYNPLTSDFDLERLRILKNKRMASRSGWAQNIAFASTEKRFTEDSRGIPPPGTYSPKVTIADNIPVPNPRAGPFGSTAKRFPHSKSNRKGSGARRAVAGESFNPQEIHL